MNKEELMYINNIHDKAYKSGLIFFDYSGYSEEQSVKESNDNNFRK